jgi:Eco47II restriction endonuclease
MAHQYVSFISDEAFESCIQYLLEKAKEGQQKALKKPERNVIDPFAALFSMAAFDLSPEAWENVEYLRQSGKTLENALGDFHQKLIGCIDGWESKPRGGEIDVICNERKIVAEIKNKYNTVKASDKTVIYKKLDDLVNIKSSNYKDYTGYYVVIIPNSAQRFNRPFTPSDPASGQRKQTKDNVREIDGCSFYKIATGYDDALLQIFESLPKILTKMTNKTLNSQHQKTLAFFKKAFGS